MSLSSRNETAAIGGVTERVKMHLDCLLESYRGGANRFLQSPVSSEALASGITSKYRQRGALGAKGERPTCHSCLKTYSVPTLPDLGGPLIADITMALEAAIERGRKIEQAAHDHSGKACFRCHFLYCRWSVTGITLSANFRWRRDEQGELQLDPDYIEPLFYTALTFREQKEVTK